MIKIKKIFNDLFTEPNKTKTSLFLVLGTIGFFGLFLFEGYSVYKTGEFNLSFIDHITLYVGMLGGVYGGFKGMRYVKNVKMARIETKDKK